MMGKYAPTVLGEEGKAVNQSEGSCFRVRSVLFSDVN